MKYDLKKAFNDLVKGFLRYPIWIYQAYHLLAAKYKRTALGTLWISGNYLFISISIAYVYGAIFHQSLKDFIPYCMLGNLAGTSMLWVILEAPEIFMINASLIKNNATPYTYYIYESVAKLMFLFMHNLVVFYIAGALLGFITFPTWEIIPGMILFMVILFFWGCVVAMASARYRDLRFLLPNFSMFMFFITPIYWKTDMLGKSAAIAELNPLYHLIAIIRNPILGLPTDLNNWLCALAVAAVGIVLWLIFFPFFRRRIPFWV